MSASVIEARPLSGQTTLQDAYDAQPIAPHLIPSLAEGLQIGGRVDIEGALEQGNAAAMNFNETYTQSAVFIGGSMVSAGTITVTNAVWIWALMQESKRFEIGVDPGFAAFTGFNFLATIANSGNFNLVAGLIMNAGLAHERNTSGTSTYVGTTVISSSPQSRTTAIGAILTATTGDTGLRHAKTFNTTAFTTVNMGTQRAAHLTNIAVALFGSSAGTELATAAIGLEVDAIPFGGNIVKAAVRSALTAATNSFVILNNGGAQSDHGAGNMHFDDNANVNFGNTLAAPDVSTAWNSAVSAWQFAFAANASQLRWSNPAADRFLFDTNGGNTLAEYNFNCHKFSLGAQTGAVGNQIGVFVAGADTITIGGEYSQFLLTQAGNLTVNANVNAFGWTINAPAFTAGTGTLTTAAALNIGGNPNLGVDRIGLRIISNPSGGAGVNAALHVTAGLSQFDGRVDINQPIALGGGAVATLGTIGGSGPTAAAQAQWVEIDINGVAHWLPAWT